MDSTLLYLFVFCGLFLLSFLLFVLGYFIPNLYNGFMRHATYPLVIRRRKVWDSVTRLELCLVILFFAVNVVVILTPFKGVDWRQIERRAAFAAGVNIIPLCLGGRMGHVVQTLNIHRSSYLLFHNWLGRIAILEAATHAIIVVCLRPTPGPLVTTGFIALTAFLAILTFSFCLVRSWLGRVFLLSHRIFTLAGIAALAWHALFFPGKTGQIMVGVCCILWPVSSLPRLYQLCFRRLTGKVVVKLTGGNATKIEVALRYPVRVSPGSYFNIFFPAESKYCCGYLHGYPAVACWHPTDADSTTRELSNITFILSHSGDHKSAVRRLKAGSQILLDGPLGQDLGLGSYETVILLCKGIGIAGVLPMALALAERQQHDARLRSEREELSTQLASLSKEIKERPEMEDDIQERKGDIVKKMLTLSRKPLFRDATRKVILFWSLDNNSQMVWVADQLKALQKLDPENHLLVVWCGYASPITGSAPFKPVANFWKRFDPVSQRTPFDDLIVSKIKEQRRMLPGRMLVTACGNPDFTSKVRQGTIDSIGDMGITFVETEFRPFGETTAPSNEAFKHEDLQQEAKEVRTLRKGKRSQDIEMQSLVARNSDGCSYSVQLD
ncbi:hypothetical protein ACJZ2D_016774 [Fusarium nematophilum]